MMLKHAWTKRLFRGHEMPYPPRITVGHDIVHIPRIRHELAELGELWTNRWMTRSEQETCGNDATKIAGRWAAKEAVVKALSWRLEEVDLRHIETRTPFESSTKPTIAFHDVACDILRQQKSYLCDVSWSHDGQYASAVAIAAVAQ